MPSASAHSTPGYGFLSLHSAPLISLLLMLHAASASAARQCFFPSGQAARSHTPCAASLAAGEHSPCCPNAGADSLCLTQTANGLCLNQHATDSRAVLYVGGCTDSSMTDGACPSFCKSVDLGDASFYAVVPCSDGTWCCSAADSHGVGDTSCCRNADLTFRLDWGSLLLLPTLHAAAAADNSLKSSSSAGSTATRLRQQPRGALRRRDDDDSASNSSASSTLSPLSEADDADDDQLAKICPPDRSAIVGLSTGVPLGVCLIAALAAIFVLLSRDRKLRERIKHMAEAARVEHERAAEQHMVPRRVPPPHGPQSQSPPPGGRPVNPARFSASTAASSSAAVPMGYLPPQTPYEGQSGRHNWSPELSQGSWVPTEREGLMMMDDTPKARFEMTP